MSDTQPTSDEKLTDIERERVADLLHNLWCAFPFRLSPQGFEYWEQVANNLRELAGDKARD